MFLLESESHAIGNDEPLLFSKERKDLDRMMVKASHKFKMQPEGYSWGTATRKDHGDER